MINNQIYIWQINEEIKEKIKQVQHQEGPFQFDSNCSVVEDCGVFEEELDPGVDPRIMLL